MSTSPDPDPALPLPERRERMVKERIVSIDLRIGLRLLGEQGRKLLIDYISLKRQQ